MNEEIRSFRLSPAW